MESQNQQVSKKLMSQTGFGIDQLQSELEKIYQPHGLKSRLLKEEIVKSEG